MKPRSVMLLVELNTPMSHRELKRDARKMLYLLGTVVQVQANTVDATKRRRKAKTRKERR